MKLHEITSIQKLQRTTAIKQRLLQLNLQKREIEQTIRLLLQQLRQG